MLKHGEFLAVRLTVDRNARPATGIHQGVVHLAVGESSFSDTKHRPFICHSH